MRSSRDSSRPSVSSLDNAFTPTYLARLRERDDSLTAAEAEFAGPWKIEPVPGRPGAVAILRIWEDQEADGRLEEAEGHGNEPERREEEPDGRI